MFPSRGYGVLIIVTINVKEDECRKDGGSKCKTIWRGEKNNVKIETCLYMLLSMDHTLACDSWKYWVCKSHTLVFESWNYIEKCVCTFRQFTRK